MIFTSTQWNAREKTGYGGIRPHAAQAVEKAVKPACFPPGRFYRPSSPLFVERDYARIRQADQRRIMLSGVILCCRI
jgi:hypothetical protein